MSHSTAPIQIQLSFEDAQLFTLERRSMAADSMFYASAQREIKRILAAAFAQADVDPATCKWDYTTVTRTINIFLPDEVPYTKEFATCATCHKYKGCWTDSEVCSDCDELEDERKMAYNETIATA